MLQMSLPVLRQSGSAGTRRSHRPLRKRVLVEPVKPVKCTTNRVVCVVSARRTYASLMTTMNEDVHCVALRSHVCFSPWFPEKKEALKVGRRCVAAPTTQSVFKCFRGACCLLMHLLTSLFDLQCTSINMLAKRQCKCARLKHGRLIRCPKADFIQTIHYIHTIHLRNI